MTNDNKLQDVIDKIAVLYTKGYNVSSIAESLHTNMDFVRGVLKQLKLLRRAGGNHDHHSTMKREPAVRRLLKVTFKGVTYQGQIHRTDKEEIPYEEAVALQKKLEEVR